jgi:Zn-dependent protease with chaperone function
LKYLYIILICFITFTLTGQNKKESASFPDTDIFLANLKAAHQLQLESYLDEKPLKATYDLRFNHIQSLFEKKEVYYDEELYDYLGRIFEIVKNSNQELRTLDLRFLVSKSPVPNAYSIGDGTFIFNVGLIRKLDNEAQLAYIINHEIAHFVLDHSNASIIEDYRLKTSKDYRKDLKKILKKKYGRFESLKSFMKNELYIEMAYSRKQETEADSLGFKYFSKTDFDATQASASLKLLDSIDHYKYQKKINFKTQLGFEAYPFKDRWIKTENSIFGKPSKQNFWETDSLKSHPDALIRAESVESYYFEEPGKKNNTFLQDSLVFLNIKSKADVQFIDSWMFYKRLDYALFFILKQLRQHPQDLDLKLKLSEVLRLIYQAQNDHRLSDFVLKPDPDNEEEFNSVLVFLNNIRLSELGKLSYFFHLENADSFKENLRFKENLNYFKNTQNP